MKTFNQETIRNLSFPDYEIEKIEFSSDKRELKIFTDLSYIRKNGYIWLSSKYKIQKKYLIDKIIKIPDWDSIVQFYNVNTLAKILSFKEAIFCRTYCVDINT